MPDDLIIARNPEEGSSLPFLVRIPLGSDGIVVNISRGSVIDEAALVAALTDGTIAGAGLDVFAREPHAPDALTALPNVVLSPHLGGHTLESHVAMQDCVLANLDAFFAGRPLPYAVKGA